MPPRSRVYRLLLHLFPEPFRARFGDEMTQVYVDRARDARAAGPVAVVRFWMRTIADVTRHGLAMRRDTRARAGKESATAAHAWRALGQDLRDAFRSLRARPGATTVALVTLALGIGANTAIFSVFHAVLLRDLPYPNADRLVQLYATNRASGMTRGVMNPFDIDQIQTRSHAIDRLTLINTGTTTLTGAGEPARLRRVSVMPSYFSIFGIRPALGRTFTDEEAVAAAKVTLISDRLWRQRFGASDAILDRPIELDGRTWTVIGVMPPYVDVPSETDFWWPVELTAQERADRGSWYLGATALLEPGVSRDQAQADIDALFRQIETQYPTQRKNRGVTLVSLRDDRSSRSGEGLKRLQAVVACVLLIACANVVNLSLARSTTRRREFAVRAALGASAWRLVRQSLTETMVLALLGAALGTAIALTAVPILVRMAPPFLLPSPQTIGVSWQAIAFTLAIAIVTGLLVGIVPALRSAASAIPDAAGHGDRTSAAGLSWSRRQRLRAGLVVTEIALAFVLLIGAGLLIRSFASLLAHPLGFKPDQMLTAQVTLPTVKYSTDDMRGVFWEQLVTRLQAVPGVTTVVASNALPFSQWEWQSGFKIAGREQQPNDGAGIRAVTPGYFAAMGMTIERGRDLLNSDIASAEHVAVVSRTFASQQLAGVEPIGQRFVFDGNPSDWITIVGVTNDALHISLDDGPRVDVYRPMAQSRRYTTMIVGLRTTGEPHALEASLKAAVRDLDPNLPVQMVMTMDELIGRNVASRRFSMTLLASFAGVAGLLAAIGIYGVMAFAVSQGRREIGIRLAIGARPGQVQSRVFAQGLRLTIIGVVIGLAGAIYLTRVLRADLVDITPTDPETFAAVVAAVLVLTSLACWIPARRTTQVDPVSVLRAE